MMIGYFILFLLFILIHLSQPLRRAKRALAEARAGSPQKADQPAFSVTKIDAPIRIPLKTFYGKASPNRICGQAAPTNLKNVVSPVYFSWGLEPFLSLTIAIHAIWTPAWGVIHVSA